MVAAGAANIIEHLNPPLRTRRVPESCEPEMLTDAADWAVSRWILSTRAVPKLCRNDREGTRPVQDQCIVVREKFGRKIKTIAFP